MLFGILFEFRFCETCKDPYTELNKLQDIVDQLAAGVNCDQKCTICNEDFELCDELEFFDPVLKCDRCENFICEDCSSFMYTDFEVKTIYD